MLAGLGRQPQARQAFQKWPLNPKLRPPLLRGNNGLEAFQHGSLPVDGLAAEGMSSLRVTHVMNFACSACDRVVFMHAGRAVW